MTDEEYNARQQASKWAQYVRVCRQSSPQHILIAITLPADQRETFRVRLTELTGEEVTELSQADLDGDDFVFRVGPEGMDGALQETVERCAGASKSFVGDISAGLHRIVEQGLKAHEPLSDRLARDPRDGSPAIYLAGEEGDPEIDE